MEFLLFLLIAVITAEGAYEGENCDLYGTPGVCKDIRQCPSAIQDIRQKKLPPPPACGNKNTEKVCCKIVPNDGVLTTTKRSIRAATTEYTPKEYDYVNTGNRMLDVCAPLSPETTSAPNGQKAWDKCLEYQEKYVFPCEKSAALNGGMERSNHCHHNADELVIGGKNAAKLEYPHMVLLGYENAPNSIDWQCGGALISEKFVLTAGHCISDTRGKSVSHALIGVLKRSQESQNNRYSIKRIIPHDNYKSPGKYHDIALLELDRNVKLDHTTVPACLHTGDDVDDSRAAATGWGTTDVTRQANSDVLQKVIVTKFTADECSAEYESERNMLEGYQERTQICYGDKTKSQDTCTGDSGGPLQIKSKKMKCMYVVVGVTSFGKKCAIAGLPAIYTRVSHYLPWIESIVWP